MGKLATLLMLASGIAVPYAALAADPAAPMDQETTSPATQKAPTTKPGAEGRSASSMFDQLDANRDGYIDSSELAKSATAKANFKAIDADGDGKVSRSEWEAFEGGGARGQR